MPKVAVSSIAKVRAIIAKYPNEFICSGKNELYCQICCVVVKHDKSFFVDKHRSTQKHQRGIDQNVGNEKTQTLLKYKSSDFSEKLVTTFLSANIPLHKLSNPHVKQLFSELGVAVPCVSTCRSIAMKQAESELSRIKHLLEGKLVFLIVDESEVRGSKYLNILAGSIDVPKKTYLIRCDVLLGNVNARTVIHKIDDTVKEFEIPRENFCLLLSDAARYMVSAGTTLKQLFPRLFHVTCLAHLLHNCAMQIRAFYSDVDTLIACVKASTLKNKRRKELFAEIGTPPEPIVTRWASWLNAAFYYADNSPNVKTVVENFEDEGIIVQKAKECVANEKLPKQLMSIKMNYSLIASLVTRMEASDCTIREAYETISSINLGEDMCSVKQYIETRLKTNGICEIINLSRPEISPTVYGQLLQCQPTTAAVERSFSMLNKLLSFFARKCRQILHNLPQSVN